MSTDPVAHAAWAQAHGIEPIPAGAELTAWQAVRPYARVRAVAATYDGGRWLRGWIVDVACVCGQTVRVAAGTETPCPTCGRVYRTWNPYTADVQEAP